MRTRCHRIRLKTSAGTVEVRAVYGQDPRTGAWLCPMRQLWNLSPRQEMSPVLEERLCFTAVLTGSFEASSQVAQKWGVSVDDSTIHAHVQQAGARAQTLQARRVDRALDPSTRQEAVADAAKRHGAQSFSLVIEMDGWMVRERGKQWGLKPAEQQGERVVWHEMKTAIIFRSGQRAQNAAGRAMLLERAYVAWRGDVHEFGRRLYAEALRQGLHQAQKVYVVADGGVWIWNLVSDRFEHATGVLDFYHASQHLWAVAQSLYPDEQRARQWIAPLLHELKHGRPEKMLSRLDWLASRPGRLSQAALEQVESERKYFHRHRGHMEYAEAEADGCPKGSGAIESTCAQFQNRFKRTGQFWTLPGENCLMALELARRNEDWDEIWKQTA